MGDIAVTKDFLDAIRKAAGRAEDRSRILTLTAAEVRALVDEVKRLRKTTNAILLAANAEIANLRDEIKDQEASDGK